MAEVSIGGGIGTAAFFFFPPFSCPTMDPMVDWVLRIDCWREDCCFPSVAIFFILSFPFGPWDGGSSACWLLDMLLVYIPPRIVASGYFFCVEDVATIVAVALPPSIAFLLCWTMSSIISSSSDESSALRMLCRSLRLVGCFLGLSSYSLFPSLLFCLDECDVSLSLVL